MAKGKVTDQEVFIIKGMYSDGMSIKEISEELSRAESTIEKYIDVKEPEPEPEAVAEQKEVDRSETTMFIKNTAGKNNSGISVMTDAESSRSDITRSKRVGKKITKAHKKNIHTISD